MGKKVVIIGAGPTGLGCATRLKQLGHEDFVIIEKTSIAGGLARSEVDEKGFTWDMGGHVIFSHYKYFTDLLNSVVPEWMEHHRESWVWCKDRFVPYPFQNNIHRLPVDEMTKCLEGVIKAKEDVALQSKKPENFQQWINKNFGEGLADIFLNPYNFKVWAYKPEQMAAQWMGERVPTVDVKRITKNIVLNQDDVGWGPNATFRFPMHRGTGEIWTQVGERVKEKTKFNSEVTEIDTDKKVVKTSDGKEYPYDAIMNTMPLDLFLTRMTGSDPLVKELNEKKGLNYSSTHIVGIGLKGSPPDHLKGKCWMYFPEDDCPFYRVTLFSHYSPNHTPNNSEYWSLMYEFSESPEKPAPENPIEATIQGSLNTKLFESKDQIVSTYHTRLEHGYPTPHVNRDAFLLDVQPKLMKMDVWSRGRFGGWKYEVGNQDHSLMQGVEAADSILFGVEEMTYFYPDFVNQRKETTRSYSEK